MLFLRADAMGDASWRPTLFATRQLVPVGHLVPGSRGKSSRSSSIASDPASDLRLPCSCSAATLVERIPMRMSDLNSMIGNFKLFCDYKVKLSKRKIFDVSSSTACTDCAISAEIK